MQIPIMAGTSAKGGRFNASFPINLEPRAVENGLSQGQLVSSRGAVDVVTGPGKDRGGIAWNGTLYRVMGGKLVSVSSAGVITALGDVADDTRPCKFDYGFGRLGIRSADRLYYWDGATLAEVTDPDLGSVVDFVWMDGYYVTTDGTYVVVTELRDPTAVDPIKYGSAEEDPDAVTGVEKWREELYVFGRHTIQVFQNVGGLTFPFQVNQGAMVPYGCISATAKTRIADTIAFVGGGRDEPLRVYALQNGTAAAISTEEIDRLLAAEPYPELIELEQRGFGSETVLYVHLSQVTAAITLRTSGEANQPAWFYLNSGRFGPYRPVHAVLCYGKHWVGDLSSSRLGVLSDDVTSHFGEEADWQFDTAAMFNDGASFIVHGVELFGQFPTGPNAVFLSMTRDGAQWSNEVSRVLTGRRDERVNWRPHVRIPAWCGLRWRGSGKVAIARAEIDAEPLAA